MIAKNSPHETPGQEFLYEHVHFNFDGNYLLAKIIFEQVAQILPQPIKTHKANKPLATRKECQQRLAYTEWTQYISTDYILDTFIKEPPFSNRLDNDKLVSQMEQKIKTLKASLTQESLKKIAEQYRHAIQISPEDGWLHWQYAKLLDDTRNYQAAIEQYRLLLECWPNYYIAHGKVALLLLETKQDTNASITYSREALRINPTYTDAYYSLALAYDMQGQIDQAEKYYNETLKLDHRYAPAWNNLAVLYSNCGRDKQAEQIYRKGLQVVKDYEDLYCNLAILLNKQTRREEALEVLRNASELHPDFTQVRKILNTLTKTRN
jgi:tetratricopeptide (TPR) repeat protein